MDSWGRVGTVKQSQQASTMKLARDNRGRKMFKMSCMVKLIAFPY